MCVGGNATATATATATAVAVALLRSAAFKKVQMGVELGHTDVNARQGEGVGEPLMGLVVLVLVVVVECSTWSFVSSSPQTAFVEGLHGGSKAM